MGRVYLPQEDLERFGVGHEELRGPVTPKFGNSSNLKRIARGGCTRKARRWSNRLTRIAARLCGRWCGLTAVFWRESKNADSTYFRRACLYRMRKNFNIY